MITVGGVGMYMHEIVKIHLLKIYFYINDNISVFIQKQKQIEKAK